MEAAVMCARYCLLLTFLSLALQGFAKTPVIEHWQGVNGADVYFVEIHELPIVDIQLIMNAGSARDPAGKSGLATLTSSLIGEGAGGKDANALSYEFERLGAVFGADAGYDSAYVSLRSLADERKLKPALNNLKLAVGKPDFPDKAMERQRNRILIGISYKQQSPSDLASDSFFAAVYGDHPYAHPKEGTGPSVKSLTREDVIAFYNQYYAARNAIIAIVGDISRGRARRLADELAGVLNKGRPAAPLPEVRPLTEGKIINVNHPSAQTHIITGQPGIRWGDPDYFPLYVGNHILGGSGLVSLLNEEIREQRGLAYSVYSYFSPMRARGPFMAGLQTRADQAGAALGLLRDNIRDYIDKGPTAAQLDAAKKNITGGFPLRFDSNRDILGYAGVIGFYNLPLNYLDTFSGNVEAVTADSIRDAFQRRLAQQKMITVIVGPAQQAAAHED
jgi:zinc protease